MPTAPFRSRFNLHAGPLASELETRAAAAARAAEGLWALRASTWSQDAAVQAKIDGRLGWLTSPTLMRESVPRVNEFANRVSAEGFTDVVLLGMGGSSLAPEVMRAVLGQAAQAPRFHMLDSTDPASVRAVVTPPATTLYILASKSGTTIEPNSLAAHFMRVLSDAGETPGRHFVAITDPDTALARRAAVEGFADVFINPPDIGGRFSALSLFGIVPSALMGQDITSLLNSGIAMLDEARQTADPLTNPAVGLGLLMGAGARAGRDKLTLLVPPSFEAFGLWVEQLVAESTGKQGVGVVPIAGEHIDARRYGPDRVLVRLRVDSDTAESARDVALAGVAGVPTLTLNVESPADLGAEFMRWEIATAIAGALLGVNPFDEPNVKQAKDATSVLLSGVAAQGTLPSPAADEITATGVTFTVSGAARTALAGQPPSAILRLAGPGDYVGILAYLGPDAELASAIAAFRERTGSQMLVPTMFGYGPRYLHSTGQLHKGGPNNGVFILITSSPADDLDIPEQPFSFGTLELAQALGDFSSLDDTGRRALRIHLPSPAPALLSAALARVLADAAKT